MARPDERLIENIADVTVGMRLVLRPCDNCGRPHRAIALHKHTDVYGRAPDGSVGFFGVAWEIEPAPACMNASRDVCWTALAVERKLLFEQIDQSPEEKRWERRIKKPRPARTEKLELVHLTSGLGRWQPKRR